jgi:hypothetical protein
MPSGFFESAGVYLVCCCALEWSLDQDSTNNGGTEHVTVLPRPGVKSADQNPRRLAVSHSTRVLRAGEPGGIWCTTTGNRVRAAAARPGVQVVVRDRTVSRVVLVR